MNSKHYALFAIIFFSTIYSHNAYAVNSMNWTWAGSPLDSPSTPPFQGATLDKGNIIEGYPFSIRVDATDEGDFTTNGIIDTIDVIVTSIYDPDAMTYTLIETGPNTGIFQGINFVFLDQDNRFLVTDIVDITFTADPVISGYPCNVDNTITQLDSRSGGSDDGMRVFSDTDNVRWTGTEWGGGVGLVLTETGENTCKFTGQLKFTTSGTSDDTSGTLLVTEGDILAFYSELTGDFWNGQIVPTSAGKGSLIAHRDANGYNPYTAEVTASYNGFSLLLDITPGWIPGSGGGGLIVKPGLVLNVLASLFGGGSALSAPPTLGLDQNQKRIVDDGFSFNDNPVNVEQYYTPYPLITTEVGKINTIKLKIYENNGLDNITHVGLSYGLGKGETFNEGKATIEFDRKFDGTEHVTLFDPKDVLGSVNVTSSIVKCSENNNAQCLEVTFDHIFRQPLEFNMVATNIWDFQRNGWQNYFNHGIHITGESMNPAEKHSGIYKGHIYHLTETGKNTAVDENGDTWTFDKTWNRNYIKQIPADNDILNQHKINAIEQLGFEYSDGQKIFGFERIDHRFEDTKYQQKIQAQSIMDSLCPDCKDESFDGIDEIFSYDIPDDSKLESETISQMKIQDKKAREFLKQYFDKIYPGIKYR